MAVAASCSSRLWSDGAADPNAGIGLIERERTRGCQLDREASYRGARKCTAVLRSESETQAAADHCAAGVHFAERERHLRLRKADDAAHADVLRGVIADVGADVEAGLLFLLGVHVRAGEGGFVVRIVLVEG